MTSFILKNNDDHSNDRGFKDFTTFLASEFFLEK